MLLLAGRPNKYARIAVKTSIGIFLLAMLGLAHSSLQKVRRSLIQKKAFKYKYVCECVMCNVMCNVNV